MASKGGGAASGSAAIGRATEDLAMVNAWRKRIKSEMDSQLNFGKEWGSLEPEDRRPAETLEGEIERVERMLEEAKAASAEPPARYKSAAHAGMSEASLPNVQAFARVETDLERSLAGVKGNFKTVGGARLAAKRAAKERAKRLGTDILEEEAKRLEALTREEHGRK